MFDTCTLGEQEDGGLAQVPSHSLEFQWVLLEFLLWGFWVSAGGSPWLLPREESGLAASGSTTSPALLPVCKRLLNTAMKTSWRQPAVSAALTNPILFHYPSQKEPAWRNRAALSSSPASAHVRNVLGQQTVTPSSNNDLLFINDL